MAARIFLYLIAIVIVLILAAAIAWNLFQDKLLEYAFVPDAPVETLAEVEQNRYAAPEMWLARPDLREDPTEWLPANLDEVRESVALERATAADAAASVETATDEAPDPAPEAPASTEPFERLPVFYVLPTTYLDNDRWNAPFRDPAALERQRLFAASQASVFNAVGDVWAPLYRQAVLGAFLTRNPSADEALRYAYRDVATAFDYFLTQIPDGQRFILAGHSQGARHLTMLLRSRIAGTPLGDRVAAAYVIGWPVSVEADLPALGLPACEQPDQANCIVSYMSYAEPADTGQITGLFDATRGLAGRPRAETHLLCSNPITGTPNGEASASENTGSLIPEEDASSAILQPGLVGARCDARGFLLIGPPPEGYGRYVLPGNNYHVFDYMLFWAALRADVARRVGFVEPAPGGGDAAAPAA